MKNSHFAGFGFVAGCGVGAGGCYLFIAKKQQQAGPVQHVERIPHPALKYGVPTSSSLREFEGYVASFDYRTRNPAWVIEHLTAENMSGAGDRSKSEFVEDVGIEERFRSKLSDYRNSGYDRGHMAPAADHKHSQSEMDGTFTLTNVSPQVGKGFNRDYWARVERFAHELAFNCKELFVVTGPLWLPTLNPENKWSMQHPLIGEAPGLVSVPTHYYKVMLADGIMSKDGVNRAAGSIGVGAFVMPNAPIDPATPLSAFSVTLDALEATAGTKFFPGLINDDKRRVIDVAANAWRNHGLQQVKIFDRQTMVQNMAVLPPPGSAADSAAARSAVATAKPGSTASAASRSTSSVPVTSGGHGVTHICELNACKLPAVDFWKNGNKDSDKKGKEKKDYKGPKFGKRSFLNLFKIFM